MYLIKHLFVGSDVMSHAENDYFEFDNVILDNNKRFLSKNKSHELVETRSQCKRMFKIYYNNNSTSTIFNILDSERSDEFIDFTMNYVFYFCVCVHHKYSK